MAFSYDDDTDSGTLRTVQETIDGHVHEAGAKIYRGTLQVLASGFGKGLLAAAALFTAGTVALAIFAPAGLGLTGLSVAEAVVSGMTIAGNTLLGSSLGAAALLVGGFAGSAFAANSQSAMISEDTANEREQMYKDISARRAANEKSPSPDLEMDNEHCKGGHCAALMQQKKQPAVSGHAR